ncbi:MAG: dodecin family protein [Gammaproteobacteria bacterium]
MSVARVTEITAESKKGFDDALKVAIDRAHKTLHYVRSAWIADQEVTVRDGKIEDYRVRLKVTFVLKD